MTLTLSLRQARGVAAAVWHAERIGLPMNRLVTVHWGALGLSDSDAGAATGRLLKLMRDALADRGLPFAHAWVRENDGGDGSKGSHVHILAHVPPAARRGFLRRLRAWARLAAGGRYNRRSGHIEGSPYAAGAVLTRRIGGRLAVEPGVRRANLAKVLAYVLKGVDEQAADILGLEQRAPGGCVIGKRCGWSENVGARARQGGEPRVRDR
ncbi:MAG: hypothetical protein ACK4Z0_05865 [Sphingomonadaceae bacterium]